MQPSIASSIVSDARSLAAAMAKDVLDRPPPGWEFDFNGGISTEVDAADLVFRVTVGDESCEGDALRMMYMTVSRYNGDELVDGVTADLSTDGLRILDTTSWFEDDECSFLRSVLDAAFAAQRSPRKNLFA
jgi:hypothetical protein